MSRVTPGSPGNFAVNNSIVPGTGATNLGKAEDAPHASGDVGAMLLAVRNDNLGTVFTTTNGDYSPIAVDESGQIFVSDLALYDRLPSSIGQKTMVDSLSVTIASNQSTLTVGAASATGAAVPANAFYFGIKDGIGQLVGVSVTSALGDSGNNSLAVGSYLYDGSNEVRVRSAINATNSTGTGITAASLVGQFDDVSPTVITENQFGNVRMNSARQLYSDLGTLLAGEDLTNNVSAITQKPIAAVTYAPLLYAPMTQVTKANIKASAGNVFSIYITNDNAAVRYFQLHDKATAPAGTNVPLISVKVPAGTANNPGVLILDNSFFTSAGLFFTTGVGWAISTTFATFTDAATNTEHISIVTYI